MSTKAKNFYSEYVSTHYQYVAKDTEESHKKRYNVWKSYVAPLLPADRSCSILEVGAGVGHNLLALQRLGYTHLEGTDYSSECVTVCKKHGFITHKIDEKNEVQFYRLHKHVFDVIVLYDVLEHYTPEKGKELLRSLKDVLKPGGRMIISLPNANHPLSNTLFFADITHKFIYNEISLSQLLRNAGFFHNTIFSTHSIAPYDDNSMYCLVKKFVLLPIANIGELFWKCVALSQGIILKECRPTLVAVVKV